MLQYRYKHYRIINYSKTVGYRHRGIKILKIYKNNKYFSYLTNLVLFFGLYITGLSFLINNVLDQIIKNSDSIAIGMGCGISEEIYNIIKYVYIAVVSVTIVGLSAYWVVKKVMKLKRNKSVEDEIC